MATSNQPRVLRIGDDKVLELITLYKLEECLWKSDRSDYAKKQKRKEALERIATTLNIPNFEAKHVTAKFKNLRSSYSQELKKVANRYAYTPKPHWFPHMEFIKPYMQTTQNVKPSWVSVLHPELNYELVNVESTSSGIPIILTGSQTLKVNKDVQHTNADVAVKVEISDDEEQEWEIENHLPLKNVTEEATQNCDNNKGNLPDIVKTLQETVNQIQAMNIEGQDHYGAFGNYVATLLRRLPEEKATRLQPQIINLIVSADLSNENELDIKTEPTL